MTSTEPLLDLSIVVNKLQEHHTVIRSRVDLLETGLQETNRRLKNLDFKVDDQTKFLNGWFVKIEERLDEHDRRFDRLDERLAKVDSRLDEHDRRFDVIDQRFVEVDKRFDGVDKRFDGVDKRFDTMETQFAELRALVLEALGRQN